jgi:hypothetical protein
MTDTQNYDYLMYKDEDSDDALALVRCPANRHFLYERWDGEQWKSVSESYEDNLDQPNWVRVSEVEALTQLPQLTERYEKLRVEAQAKKDLEERQRVRDQRLNFTLRGMDGGWTEMEKAAVALHKLFTSLFEAGFTEDQASRMVTELFVQPKRDATPPLLPIQQSVN